ncbi:hypothetical protein FPF71_16910 [Algibacter amylolyticus]|uniref:Uncharacterized protein n=1 Tax=Algibacter amylolyticus TaxID=1608400 RepID=A0A5M7B135_9FLAO|nr:hypothetical protein [Algibacter amylolyticus]KAA5821184.1 hypothetical protein F2B50_16910 [Algibacter amylolyticus]MBB5269831.1 hypothetical protein [Algibacter amylolyticus]TSJ72130.1 hypothetical protein FPF71_16910 [Algibacter amylolyticus]
MMLKDLVGHYTVVGRNQDDEPNTYKGSLSLTLDENNRIKAKWLINKNQEQFGTGFFKDNILVINFNYKMDHNVFKGVVVYKCLSKDVLDGFWSEKHGDPNYLGKEQCFRADSTKEVIN